MTGNDRGDYVGRHRKPDHEQTDAPRESLQRRTFELFTHGTQPIHIQNGRNDHGPSSPRLTPIRGSAPRSAARSGSAGWRVLRPPA